MKINRANKILTILMVIAFCLIQTRYQNEPSSSIISVASFLLKDMSWNEMINGARVLGLIVIGIFVINILILVVAIMNKRGLLFGISLLHIGFWFFIWNFYGSFIILVSALPYFIFIISLVGLLVIKWLKPKMKRNSTS